MCCNDYLIKSGRRTIKQEEKGEKTLDGNDLSPPRCIVCHKQYLNDLQIFPFVATLRSGQNWEPAL